jgi:hypothetical protein
VDARKGMRLDSSVKNTFVTPSRWMSDCADVFIIAPCGAGPQVVRPALLSAALDRSIELRHVGEDHLVAGLQPLDDFDRVTEARPSFTFVACASPFGEP